MKSSRKLDFSVCSLCGSSHSHTSSPGEWKNVEAKKYILSLGISANSQVCRPCRQDTTRALADSAYIPRWEKGKEASKTTCCVLNCTELAIARANLCSTNDLSQLDIDFPPLPIPTPTPLCRSHYHAVYDALQTRQKNCRTCGRRLRLGNDRPCPQPEKICKYLLEHTDFNGYIADTDRVCFTCYKSHLALLKDNEPISTDNELRPLVESLKCNCIGPDDIVRAAANRMLFDVGTMLLANRATLLPTICANFNQHAEQLLHEHGVEAPLELKQINSRWILCELKAKYEHHITCKCKVRKYGTLVYRPTTDVYTLLSEALWRLSRHEANTVETGDTTVTPALHDDVCSIIDLNRLVHSHIEYISKASQDYDEFDLNQHIAKVSPQLWHAIQTITRSKAEMRGLSKVLDSTSPAYHLKNVRCFFLLCIMMYITDDRCSMPMHTLMTDYIESQGGSSILVKPYWWTQSDRNTMVLPPITEHGWTLQDTSLKIIWDTEQNMQKVRERVNILFGGCKCRTGCKSRVCGCRRKQKLCSEGCECTNCGNNASPVHNSDGFSDPDEAAVESSGETEDEAEFADFVLAEAMDKF